MKKNRSGFLGTIGAAGLAILAALPSTQQQNLQQNTKQESQNVQSQKQKENAPVQTSNQVTAKDQLPDEMGGLKLGGKSFDFGIPPHIYGVYHVRRGTHKRSNKC